MIYIECYSDEVLIKALGIIKRNLKHTPPKGTVCNNLKKNNNHIGIVDQDPKSVQPSYLNDKKVDDQYISYKIKIYFDSETKNKLIMLCPNLESWILEIAKETSIKLSDYNLPDREEELHTIGSNKKKLKFLEEFLLKAKESSKMLQTLESLVN